ncbi:MAG TPA: hypothetical protein VIV66_10670 [Pyrinomonadaceae bacterium]
MHASDHQPWLRTVILVGVLYFVVGIAFGTFAGWTASNQMRFTWRLLAFIVSGVAFAIHIGFEHKHFGNSAFITALRVCLAVAVGAFALAVAANVHGQRVGSTHQRLLVFALVAWPVMTAVPAFVVALVAASLLGLKRRST